MTFQKDLSHADWAQMAQRQAARLDLVREWIALAGIGPGSRVLDIGPGAGQFTCEYARLVGPTGTVYALEKAESAVAYLRGVLEERALTNVVVRAADAEQPVTIAGDVDAVMITDVLHHADRPQAMVRHVVPLLRSAGMLLIAEFDPAGEGAIGPPVEHRLAPAPVKQWLAEAGLRLRGEGRQRHEHYYLLAVR